MGCCAIEHNFRPSECKAGIQILRVEENETTTRKLSLQEVVQ